VTLGDGNNYTNDLNIENIHVGSWFPNNFRGKIRLRQK
jgi:hypothetical protein